MPDPSERMMPERRRARLSFEYVGRLLAVFVGIAFGFFFIVAGLNMSGIGRIFSPHQTGSEAPSASVDVDAKDGAFDESATLLLGKFCRPGPEFISECRLLERNFCNQPALQAVMQKLANRHDYPSSASLGQAFLKDCDLDELVGLWTAKALYRTTRFEDALNVINQFPDEVASHPEFASWSGFVHEKLDLFEAAALDFQRALYLFPDISNVALSQFFYVVKNLKSAGRYCEALEPLRLFVSFDPAGRMTTQVAQEISVLRRLGKCEDDIAPGLKNVELEQRGGLLIVKAEVNGVAGRFVLDTGASTVHLTKEYAARADILLSEKRRIHVRGVTGIRLDYLADARRVNVRGFVARNVTVTVASAGESLEEGIDGLLGQTYLSRFKYGIDGTSLSLRRH